MGARVAFEDTPRPHRPRAYLGVDWIPSKHHLLPIIAGVGFGSSIGGRLFLALTAEARMMRLAHDVVTAQFSEGTLDWVDRRRSGAWVLDGGLVLDAGIVIRGR